MLAWFPLSSWTGANDCRRNWLGMDASLECAACKLGGLSTQGDAWPLGDIGADDGWDAGNEGGSEFAWETACDTDGDGDRVDDEAVR